MNKNETARLLSSIFSPEKKQENKFALKMNLFLLPFIIFFCCGMNAQSCTPDNANCYVNASVKIKVRTNDTWPANYLTIGYAFAASDTPAHGTITILNSDSILYTPDANYVGPDHFRYGVAAPGNPTSAVDTASVNINVVTNPACGAVGSYTDHPGVCLDTMIFVGTTLGMPGPLTWYWDFGTGIYSSQPFNAPYQYTTAGTYTVTLVVTDQSTGCASAWQSSYTITHGVKVDAGNNINACQSLAQLNATPIIPSSGNLSYSWSPVNSYINNSAIQNPNVSHADNTMYFVTMTDNTSGCSATDSVLVSAYNVIAGPIYACNTYPVTLDFGPGASGYFWQNFQDTAGVNHPLSANTQTYSAMAPGQYFGYATFPTCGALTSLVTVNSSCASTCSLQVVANGNQFYCGNVPASSSLISTSINATSNCVVSWSPQTYLSNANTYVATLDFTLINQHAGPVDINYVVTVTDTVTNCTSSDTIHVFAAMPFNDSINTCGNNPVVLTGHANGVINYSWTPGFSTTSVLTVTSAGNYFLAEDFGNGCTLTSNYAVTDTCPPVPCTFSVNAGASPFYCAGPPSGVPTFSASVSQPSSNYIYLWTPSTGLSDPTTLNPTVSNVYNQVYTLTVTDTANNCSAADTVNAVSLPYQYSNLYNCALSPVTIYNPPGAYQYQWMSGFSPNPPQTQNSTIVTTPGSYCYAAFYVGCAVTSCFTLTDSCGAQLPNVWPGDCNYDLTADYLDFLNICMAYGNTGPARPSASMTWAAQPMADWGNASYNTDDKHADCDGNGVVDINDANAIIQNYNLTHAYRLSAPSNNSIAADMYLVANKDTAALGDTVIFDVVIGTTSVPVPFIYAVAYQLTYDSIFIGTMGNVIYSNSWFGNPGTNLVSMEKKLPSYSQIDCGVGGNNQINRGGQGKIGQVSVIVTTDNLSGVFHMNLQNVFAIDESEVNIPLNISGASVVIDSLMHVGIDEEELLNSFVNLFPNPAKDEVFISAGKLKINSITVFDMLGNSVNCEKQSHNNNTIRISSLARGIYNVSVQTEKGIVNKKLVVQ